MTVRFIKQWNGYGPGDSASMTEAMEAALVVGGYAVNAVAADQAAGAMPAPEGNQLKTLMANQDGTGLMFGAPMLFGYRTNFQVFGGGNADLPADSFAGAAANFVVVSSANNALNVKLPTVAQVLAQAPWIPQSQQWLGNQSFVTLLMVRNVNTAGNVTLVPPTDGSYSVYNGEPLVIAPGKTGIYTFEVWDATPGSESAGFTQMMLA